jgi:hypothetical protein
MSDILVIQTAGYSEPDELSFWPGPSKCGEITDGVTLSHAGEGGWVISFADLERMYLAAKEARTAVGKSAAKGNT